jgi:hypothetical protein
LSEAPAHAFDHRPRPPRGAPAQACDHRPRRSRGAPAHALPARLALLENISDEHGLGNLRVSHEGTFLALLGRLGVTPEEVERRALWPEVRAFNTVLAGVATLDETPTALAAMGIIEDLFARISARIGRTIVDREWRPKDQIVHYATHERLDEQHVEGFYAQLRAPFARHPRHAYQVTPGVRARRAHLPSLVRRPVVGA